MRPVILFAGPSLWPMPDLPPAILHRPPAAGGDIMRALLHDRPAAIALVDGTFGSTPSVRHKEILAALEEGIPVLGAASMGALRAAELAPFGMIGIGRIFEGYRSGRIVADAEVAVAHAPAELGWRPLTLALADLRFALDDLVQAGEVGDAASPCLLAAAGRQFFKERTLQTVLAALPGLGLSSAEEAALAAALQRKPPGQKRLDALALLRRLTAGPPGPPTTLPVQVARTPALARLRRAAGTVRPAGPPA